MSHYKHLTPKEREKILLLYEKNYSISSIAEAIGLNLQYPVNFPVIASTAYIQP